MAASGGTEIPVCPTPFSPLRAPHIATRFLSFTAPLFLIREPESFFVAGDMRRASQLSYGSCIAFLRLAPRCTPSFKKTCSRIHEITHRRERGHYNGNHEDSEYHC